MQELDPDQYATLIVQQYLYEHGYASGTLFELTESPSSAKCRSGARQSLPADHTS